MNKFKQIYIAVVGRSNVGKSTLVNTILQKQVSITAHKRHTTRCNVWGAIELDDCQYVFVDTPGLVSATKNHLSKQMNKNAYSAINNVDLMLFVIDQGNILEEDRKIWERLPSEIPVYLLINKSDQLKSKSLFLPLIDKLQKQFIAEHYIPCSATTGYNVDEILLRASIYARDIDPCYKLSINDSEEFFITEIIREQLIRLLNQELPQHINIVLEHRKETDKLLTLHVQIQVMKPSQKAIVIGKNGGLLKKIGTVARKKLEDKFNKPIMLKQFVKVAPNWQETGKITKPLTDL